MLSSTDPDFPLCGQRSFMKFLAAGGKVEEIDRYLRRVEQGLKPVSGDAMSSRGSLRDLATLLRIEMAHQGVRGLEKRIHEAARLRERALAKLDRAAASFEGQVTSAIRAIVDAASLLEDSALLDRIEQSSGRHTRFSTGSRARYELVRKAGELNAALSSAAALSNPDLRREAFVAMHDAESGRVLWCLEALENSRWKLASRSPRHDLPGKFGVVKSGHFANYIMSLRTAEAAWRKADRATVQQAERVALEFYEAADAHIEDMAGMSEDLMNWLAIRSSFNMQPLRQKAGKRRREVVKTHCSQIG